MNVFLCEWPLLTYFFIFQAGGLGESAVTGIVVGALLGAGLLMAFYFFRLAQFWRNISPSYSPYLASLVICCSTKDRKKLAVKTKDPCSFSYGIKLMLDSTTVHDWFCPTCHTHPTCHWPKVQFHTVLDFPEWILHMRSNNDTKGHCLGHHL